MDRFVRPDITTLPISGGDTLTVKRRLTAGEYNGMLARMATVSPDGAITANPFAVGLALITTYLLDWTFTQQGAPVVIAGRPLAELESALNTLDPDTFTEIREAISAHVEAQREQREAEKKTPTIAA
jgi:hypothetical protein